MSPSFRPWFNTDSLSSTFVHNLHLQVPVAPRLNFFLIYNGPLYTCCVYKRCTKFPKSSNHGMHLQVSPCFQPSVFHSSDFFCTLHVFLDSSSLWFYFFSNPPHVFVWLCLVVCPLILDRPSSWITRLSTRFFVFTPSILYWNLAGILFIFILWLKICEGH